MRLTVSERPVSVEGCAEQPEYLIIQPTDMTEKGVAEEECALLRALLPDASFALAAFGADWQNDLPPWRAEPVFRGQPPFGDGADRTLTFILEELLPALAAQGCSARHLLLGGYSLAGLFVLYGGYRTGRFSGICAASPSVWYPDWLRFAGERRFLARAAYLSLGDREAKTRHVLMRTVQDALTAQHTLLQNERVDTVLKFNPGNHFADACGRTAAGFAWLIGTLEKPEEQGSHEK